MIGYCTNTTRNNASKDVADSIGSVCISEHEKGGVQEKAKYFSIASALQRLIGMNNVKSCVWR